MGERFPNAPESQDGSLGSTLAWITKTYPKIDLVSPPTRPAPLAEVAAEVAASLPPPR
jgi:hypothetical protein